MRSTNYTNDLNLGDDDGMKNVLVRTFREVDALPTAQKPWATMKNTAAIVGVPLPTLYSWIYKDDIPYRRLKKRESDRMGITLIPVRIALEFARNRSHARHANSHPWVKDAMKSIKEIPESRIEKFIDDLHAIINRQAAQLGKWPIREMAKAFRGLKDGLKQGDKEGGNEPKEVQ